MILATREQLSRRRLLLVIALLCVMLGAFVGLHAGADGATVTGVCMLGGLACALAVVILLSPRIRRLADATAFRSPRTRRRRRPSRGSRETPPPALELSVLCSLRI